MICAEALCCGTMMVAFKCGAPKTIFNNQFAHFVEYGDMNGIIEAVK